MIAFALIYAIAAEKIGFPSLFVFFMICFKRPTADHAKTRASPLVVVFKRINWSGKGGGLQNADKVLLQLQNGLFLQKVKSLDCMNVSNIIMLLWARYAAMCVCVVLSIASDQSD